MLSWMIEIWIKTLVVIDIIYNIVDLSCPKTILREMTNNVRFTFSVNGFAHANYNKY